MEGRVCLVGVVCINQNKLNISIYFWHLFCVYQHVCRNTSIDQACNILSFDPTTRITNLYFSSLLTMDSLLSLFNNSRSSVSQDSSIHRVHDHASHSYSPLWMLSLPWNSRPNQTESFVETYRICIQELQRQSSISNQITGSRVCARLQVSRWPMGMVVELWGSLRVFSFLLGKTVVECIHVV